MNPPNPLPPDVPLLIAALLDPRRYPGAVQQVDLVQTHISWVLLAGDFAYKIKKPLKLPFLDFSTLALRQLRCEDELRLNQRFAPDIYLEVVGIFNTPEDPRLEGTGAPIDYAVKMRRFDEAARLDRVCARGELQPQHLSDLAATLTAFHEAAASAPASSRFGSPPQIAAQAQDNFDDLASVLPDADWPARLSALQCWTQDQMAQLTPVMLARQHSGRVRECHGDLHLANLVLLDGRMRLFDCIEFNEDLRWMDVASELAFTYIDLLAHGQPGLAGWFVNECLSASGDYGAAQVLRFYAVYRALVRAKVAGIRARQTGPAAANDLQEVQAYVALAERLAAPPAPRLVITHGLSGCGKTVASTALLQSDLHATTLRLRSDVERKRLFGLSATARSGSPDTHTSPNDGLNQGIYTPQAHRHTFGHLQETAQKLLNAGWSVIVDATFLRRADRAVFETLAHDTGVAFGILAPQATPAQLRERIEARHALGQDASEATLEVLAQQIQVLEPLTAQERQHLIALP
jgi:aminoglycoside phosphotransferase family enzyme/predicted kinase